MRSLVGPALPLRSLQATFVAPLPAGTVGVDPDVLRAGRSVTHASCRLRAADELTTTVVAIFGAARASAYSWKLPVPAVDTDPDTLQDMQIPSGVGPSFVRHFRMRWVRGTPPYTGYHEPRTLILARMRDPGVDPEAALVALADCIPSPVVSMYTRPAPASTLNWTLDMLADPAQLDTARWSIVETEIRAGSEGYGSQVSVLWNAAGDAMSVSHQAVGVFG